MHGPYARGPAPAPAPPQGTGSSSSYALGSAHAISHAPASGAPVVLTQADSAQQDLNRQYMQSLGLNMDAAKAAGIAPQVAFDAFVMNQPHTDQYPSARVHTQAWPNNVASFMNHENMTRYMSDATM